MAYHSPNLEKCYCFKNPNRDSDSLPGETVLDFEVGKLYSYIFYPAVCHGIEQDAYYSVVIYSDDFVPGTNGKSCEEGSCSVNFFDEEEFYEFFDKRNYKIDAILSAIE